MNDIRHEGPAPETTRNLGGEIVVTGSSGFVGTNLCPYLVTRGWKVTCLSLRDPAWRTQISSDATAIIHLAGLAHDLRNASRPQDYVRVNTDLTAALFNHFLESSITKFVYLSSVKAVADSLGSRVLDEDHSPEPATPYGISKRRAEEYILSKDPGGKQVYVLRPCMIHGPGNKGNLNLLYRLVSLGLPWPLAAFENARSFLSVENLSFVVEQACARNISSGVYNIADSGYLSTVEVVQIMRSVLGSRAPTWRLSRPMVRTLARAGSWLRLPLNEERLAKLTESYMVDNRKILRAIERELPLSAEDGLARTIQSFAK